MGIAYDAVDDVTQAAITATLVERLATYVTPTGANIPFRSHCIKAHKN
ncbi:MAG: hypothetical protein KDA17_07145 [Candidatus Saccharibacteria bacterium]|nr:hypothetical protein [Candidatus Saccharibacteria bacterium]